MITMILLLLNDDTMSYNITDVFLTYFIVLNKYCLVLFMQAQAERLIIEGQSAIECKLIKKVKYILFLLCYYNFVKISLLLLLLLLLLSIVSYSIIYNIVVFRLVRTAVTILLYIQREGDIINLINLISYGQIYQLVTGYTNYHYPISQLLTMPTIKT